jgi:hypothetical protein
MFKGLTWFVLKIELNLTNAKNLQQCVQVQCIKATAKVEQSQYPKCRSGNIKTVLP